MAEKLIVWAAGFTDGEGTITFQEDGKDSGRIVPTFSIPNTYIKAVYRFRDIVKCGAVTTRSFSNSKWKDCATLRIGGDEAITVCQLLLPFLFVKRRQAELILEFSALPVIFEKSVYADGGSSILSQETFIKRLILNDEMKELNHKGK